MAESSRKSDTISKLELEVESHLATIAECEARRREDETIRRQLHNTIQELKGQLGWAVPYVFVFFCFI